jgi:hypothetical protein
MPRAHGRGPRGMTAEEGVWPARRLSGLVDLLPAPLLTTHNDGVPSRPDGRFRTVTISPEPRQPMFTLGNAVEAAVDVGVRYVERPEVEDHRDPEHDLAMTL